MSNWHTEDVLERHTAIIREAEKQWQLQLALHNARQRSHVGQPIKAKVGGWLVRIGTHLQAEHESNL